MGVSRCGMGGQSIETGSLIGLELPLGNRSLHWGGLILSSGPSEKCTLAMPQGKSQKLRKAARDQRSPSGSPSLWAPHFPSQAPVKKLKLLHKEYLGTIVQLERVGLGAVFARTLHTRLRKTVNITHQKV